MKREVIERGERRPLRQEGREALHGMPAHLGGFHRNAQLLSQRKRALSILLPSAVAAIHGMVNAMAAGRLQQRQQPVAQIIGKGGAGPLVVHRAHVQAFLRLANDAIGEARLFQTKQPRYAQHQGLRLGSQHCFLSLQLALAMTHCLGVWHRLPSAACGHPQRRHNHC